MNSLRMPAPTYKMPKEKTSAPASPGRARRCKRSLVTTALLGTTFFTSWLHAANRTWNSGGFTNNWTEAANWGGLTGVAPVSGDTVIFGSGAKTSVTNDLPALSTITIQFNAGAPAFTLSGNPIILGGTLDGGTNNNNPETINLDMKLTANRNINVGANDKLTINGAISEDATPRQLSMTNSGILTLAGPNTFSGGFQVDGQGTVKVGSDGALGTGETRTPNGLVTFESLNGDRVFAQNFRMNTAASNPVTFQGVGNFTFNGLILGGNRRVHVSVEQLRFSSITETSQSDLYKQGPKTLVVTGNASHSGNNFIENGVLAVGGTLSTATGVVELGNSSTAGVLATNGSIAKTIGSSVGQMRWMGTAGGGFAGYGQNATWGNAANNLTVNLNSGAALTWQTTGFLPAATSILTLGATVSNGTVTFQNAIGFGNAVRTVNVERGATAPADGNDAVLSGLLSGTGTTAALLKTGAGTLALTANNTLQGITTIAAGTLSVPAVAAAASAQPLGTNATVVLGVASTSSGALRYTGAAATLFKNISIVGNGADTIQNSGTGELLISATLTKNTTNLTLKGGTSGITVSGTITGTSATTLNVDAGITTLSNATISNNSTIVKSTGTLRGVSASTIGAVTVQAGGTIDPGTSADAAGSLSTSNLTFEDTATYRADVGGTGANDSDRLVVTGSVTLANATLDLNKITGYTPAAGHTIILISNDDVDDVSGTFAGLPQGGLIANVFGTTLSAQISYQGGDGNDVTISLFQPVTATAGALAFDGVDDYVEIPTSNDFNPASGTFTIEGWVRPITGMPRWSRIWGSEGNTGDLLAKWNTQERFAFTPSINGTIIHVVAPGNWETGKWYHVAGVLDGRTARLFVNGEQVKAVNYSGNWTPDAGKRYIGKSIAGDSFLVKGAIDEVRFWNYPRNCDEIGQTYDKELNLGVAQPGLVAYYKFNQGSASGNNNGIATLVDSVGGHQGILHVEDTIDGRKGFELADGNSTSNFIDPRDGGIVNGDSALDGVITGSLAPTPDFVEINVTGNSIKVWDGDTSPSLADHTDFGSPNAPVTRTFTIASTGTRALELTGITLSGPNAGAFGLGGYTKNPGAIPVAGFPLDLDPGESLNFNVSVGVTASDSRFATVNIASDDCDEGVYDFAIRSAPAIQITTTGNSIAVNDASTAGTAITVSQSAAGTVTFAAENRIFSIDDTDFGDGNSGAIPLSGKNSITINGTAGNDTINIGGVTGMPNVVIDGNAGDDTFNVTGDIGFNAGAGLDADLLDGVDSVSLVAGANVVATGNGTIRVRASKSVTLATGSSLETQHGNLTIEANQQTTASAGSFVAVSVNGGLVQATGAGIVSVKGRGGNGSGGAQIGVRVQSGGQIKGGSSTYLEVVGTGGNSTGSNNYGVIVTGANSAVGSNGCSVLVTGVEGGGTTGFAVVATASGAITTAANGGRLALVGNSMHFDTTAIVSTANNSDLTLLPAPGVSIALGSTANPIGGPLSLSDAELDRMTTGTLNIGDVSSGPITQSTAITRTSATHINLTSGGAITGNSGTLNSNGGNVTLDPGGVSTNIVNPVAAGVDVNAGAGSMTFGNGDNLAIAINSTAVDSGYRQLNVVGEIDLNDVTLLLTGSLTPQPGQLFTIVNNDGTDAVTGQLKDSGGNPLVEGSTVTLNGVPLTLSYAGGVGGNDVTLGYARPVLTVAKSTFSVPEGTTATNNGTFSDLQGNGTVHIAADIGEVVKSNNGTWTWSNPAPDGPAGLFVVTVTATDNSNPALSVSKTFSYGVTNLAPIAQAQTVNIDEDASATPITLVAVDPAGADDSPLTYSIVGPPLSTKGTLGTLNPTTGAVTFTPNPNVNGIITFTFKATDPDGLAGNTATVTVNVAPINDPPTFVNGANKAHPAGTTTAVAPTAWATALNDGDPEITQTLSFTVTEITDGGPSNMFDALPVISSTGALSYDLNGTSGIAKFKAVLSDGLLNSVDHVFYISVGAFTNRTGTYTALVRPANDAEVTQQTFGRLSGTLSPTGVFTANVNFAGTSTAFTATFDAATGSATGSNASGLAWNLVLGASDKMTGTVSKTSGATTFVCDVDADRATFSTTNPVPSEYRNGTGNAAFTVAFPAKTQDPDIDITTYPQGFGVGTVTVTPSGTVSITGTLADGTAVTASAPMSKTYQWPLAIIIKSSTTVAGTTLGGMVQFNAGLADSDLSAADLLWFRTAFASAPSYDDGWPDGITVDAVGCRYNSATTVQTSLGLGTPNPNNGKLMFTDGKLTADATITTFKIVGSTVTKNPTTDSSYTLVVSQPYGTFNGTFTPDWPSPSATKPSFKGIIMQKGTSKGGFGFFLSNATDDTNPASGAATLGAP